MTARSAVSKKGVDVVVGTPGRLLDLIRRKVLELDRVATVVLDEADEMLSMGFIADIEAILDQTASQPSDRPFFGHLAAAHSPVGQEIHERAPIF